NACADGNERHRHAPRVFHSPRAGAWTIFADFCLSTSYATPRRGIVADTSSRPTGDIMTPGITASELAAPQPDPAEDAFFAAQATTRDRLPDPRPLLENLTRCIIE